MLFTLPEHYLLRLPEFIEQDAIRNKWKLRDAVRQMKSVVPTDQSRGLVVRSFSDAQQETFYR